MRLNSPTATAAAAAAEPVVSANNANAECQTTYTNEEMLLTFQGDGSPEAETGAVIELEASEVNETASAVSGDEEVR